MRPVDSHCHLSFDQYEENLEEVIERAREELDFVVTAGCDLESNAEVLEISERHRDFVIPNLGLHPTFTDSFDGEEDVKRQIREEEPAAIGEIGLDHHHVTEESMRARQREVFEEMIGLAEQMGKPVVVHSREAEQDCIDMLGRSELEDVMMHCFNGTVEEAEEAVREGFKIGVTTQVLYSSRVEELVKALEIEDILLETDSPFLYPDGVNEPSNTVETVTRISEIKGVPETEVIEATTGNARRLFDQ